MVIGTALDADDGRQASVTALPAPDGIAQAVSPELEFATLRQALVHYTERVSDVSNLMLLSERQLRALQPRLEGTRTFRDLRLSRVLGEGGFGTVFLGHRTDLGGQTVAVKVLHPKQQTPAAAQLASRRFHHEANMLGKLGRCVRTSP